MGLARRGGRGHPWRDSIPRGEYVLWERGAVAEGLSLCGRAPPAQAGDHFRKFSGEGRDLVVPPAEKVVQGLRAAHGVAAGCAAVDAAAAAAGGGSFLRFNLQRSFEGG